VQAWPLALPAAHADQQPSRAPERSPIPLLSFRSRGQSAPVGSGVFSWQKFLDLGTVIFILFYFIWQLLFNHGLIRRKRFVSRFHGELCN
jgi:hypothetical protein